MWRQYKTNDVREFAEFLYVHRAKKKKREVKGLYFRCRNERKSGVFFFTIIHITADKKNFITSKAAGFGAKVLRIITRWSWATQATLYSSSALPPWSRSVPFFISPSKRHGLHAEIKENFVLFVENHASVKLQGGQRTAQPSVITVSFAQGTRSF